MSSAASERRNGRIGEPAGAASPRPDDGDIRASRTPPPRAEDRCLLNARTHPDSFLSATGIASMLRICGNRAAQLDSLESLTIR